MQVGINADRTNPSANLSAPQGAPKPTKGALIVVDSFQSSSSHGYLVEGAAVSLGKPENLFRVSQHQSVDGRATMPHVAAIGGLQAEVATVALPADQASAGFSKFVTNAAAGNLQLATTLLAGIQAQGFQNSVVNLSQGLDALTLLQLAKYPMGPTSKLPPEQQRTYTDNLRRALSAPAEATAQQLDNLMLQRIKKELKESPEIGQAVEDWRNGVSSFESAHNSVVVAAGNSGKALKGLTAAGFEIDGSEDTNILAVPEVTTVGASVTSPAGVSLSGTSSFGPEVDVVADGDFHGHFGTSFASPKVANVLRAVHVARPDLISDQAEQWVKGTLAEQVAISGQAVGLLDSAKASYFINQVNSRR